VRTHDLTGDGKADLVAVNSNSLDALISDGSKFTFATWLTTAFTLDTTSHIEVDDVTGDGLADGVDFDAKNFIGVIRSSGVHGGTVAESYETWEPQLFCGDTGTFVADVDGDGKSDAVAVQLGGIIVSRSTGESFGAPVIVSYANLEGCRRAFVADVDVDGRADVICLTAGAVLVLRSNGADFGPPVIWRGSSFDASRGVFFADVDGDGRADGILMEDSATMVALSDGSGLLPETMWYDGLLPGELATFVVDVDGDGRADVVAVDRASVSVALSTGSAFAPPTVWYEGQFHAERVLTAAPEPSGRPNAVICAVF